MTGQAATPRPGPERAAPAAPPRWRGVILRAVAATVVVAVALGRGHVATAVIVGGIGVALTAVGLASPAASEVLDRVGLAIGRAAGTVVALLGVGLVDLLVSVPARAIGAVRRLGARRSGGSGTWRSRVGPGTAPGALWSADVPGRHRPRRRPARVVTGVAALLLLDVAVGSCVPQPALPPWTQPTEALASLAEPRVAPVLPGPLAPLADAPALADQRSARACLEEADRLAYAYVQFVIRGLVDTAGRCITVAGGERRTLAPAAADVPEIWLLGGSAAFGVGQRDDHTIASELVRQSAAAGTPVRVRNLAVPGDTAYQEALRLDQLLAERPAPDLVILYDGMVDVAAQIAGPTDRATMLPATLVRSTTPAGSRSLWDRWRGASLVARVAHHLRAVAAAEPAAPDQAGSSADADPSEVAEAALGTYARGVHLARTVGARHGVAVVSVFQAVEPAADDRVTPLVLSHLPAGVRDGSDALGDAAATTSFDPIHVDERGAMVVARHLRSLLADTVLGGTR